MARLVEAPKKYTAEEWHRSNLDGYEKSEQERKASEMIRDESARLANETDITTHVTQSDVNKCIEQRINDITFWKSELDRQYEENENEVQKLLTYQKRLSSALEATQIPLHISKECQRNRTNRMAIDLVHDDVEVQLNKEIHVIQGVQSLLTMTLDQATEQIRLLRSSNFYIDKEIKDKFSALTIDSKCAALNNNSPNKYFAPDSSKSLKLLRSSNFYIDKEIKDKFSALTIDSKCAALNNNSPNKYFAPDSSKSLKLLRSSNFYIDKEIKDKFSALTIDSQCAALNNNSPNKYFALDSSKSLKSTVTPEQWEAFNNKNLRAAEQQRIGAVKLQSVIDEILNEAFEDQQKQFDNVNLALTKRIDETEQAKNKMQDHLDKVECEIKNMESNISSLQQVIDDKQAPSQLSQTRLDARSTRPNNELCGDRAHYRLIEEGKEIARNIQRLNAMLGESEDSLKALRRQQLTLKESSEIKANTLVIDRDQNVTLRNQISHKQF